MRTTDKTLSEKYFDQYNDEMNKRNHLLNITNKMFWVIAALYPTVLIINYCWFQTTIFFLFSLLNVCILHIVLAATHINILNKSKERCDHIWGWFIFYSWNELKQIWSKSEEKQFGDRLKNMRLQAGKTMGQASNFYNIRVSEYSSIEHNRK